MFWINSEHFNEQKCYDRTKDKEKYDIHFMIIFFFMLSFSFVYLQGSNSVYYKIYVGYTLQVHNFTL